MCNAAVQRVLHLIDDHRWHERQPDALRPFAVPHEEFGAVRRGGTLVCRRQVDGLLAGALCSCGWRMDVRKPEYSFYTSCAIIFDSLQRRLTFSRLLEKLRILHAISSKAEAVTMPLSSLSASCSSTHACRMFSSHSAGPC